MKPKPVGHGARAASAELQPLVNLHGTGIPAGTIVLSQDGEIPVEFLLPGDRIVTRGSGLLRLDGVCRLTRRLPAVHFATGALGNNRSQVLPAAQPVLIRGQRAADRFGQPQALVPAAALVDGAEVQELGSTSLVLHQLLFAAPQVVYAGGLELGTGGPVRAARRAA